MLGTFSMISLRYGDHFLLLWIQKFPDRMISAGNRKFRWICDNILLCCKQRNFSRTHCRVVPLFFLIQHCNHFLLSAQFVILIFTDNHFLLLQFLYQTTYYTEFDMKASEFPAPTGTAIYKLGTVIVERTISCRKTPHKTGA